MNAPHSPKAIQVLYFDGRVSTAHEVSLSRHGPTLRLVGPGIELSVPLSQVNWPERTCHGARLAHLASGGSIQALSNPDWDDWVRQHGGQGESLVVAAQQSWRGALLATTLLVSACIWAYVWGLPMATDAAVRWIPASAEKHITEGTLQTLDQHLLRPSKLPPEAQQRLSARFRAAVAQRFPGGDAPPWSLVFRDGGSIGPNAFALPDGTLVVTDALYTLLADQPDVMLGVLGHELGHVRRRHAMRGMVQAGVVGTVAGLVLGDISTLLATAPVLLGKMAYSRDFEREADDEAIAFLRANGIRPSVMRDLFTRLNQARSSAKDSSPLGIAFSSHPADEERMARFLEADRATP